MKESCQTALKEWSIIVRALLEGRQMLLLRKGGIRETLREFTVEEDEFFLFPTFEHQHPGGVREPFQGWLKGLPAQTPQILSIDTYVTVEKVFQLGDPQQVTGLSSYHIYSNEQILERFRYKPAKPLYLVLLRSYRLPAVSIQNLPSYAGCRSWVPLEAPLSTRSAVPVMPDAVFQEKAREILKLLS